MVFAITFRQVLLGISQVVASMGAHTFLFSCLDDLVLACSVADAPHVRPAATYCLEAAGFGVNVGKSGCWVPLATSLDLRITRLAPQRLGAPPRWLAHAFLTTMTL